MIKCSHECEDNYFPSLLCQLFTLAEMESLSPQTQRLYIGHLQAYIYLSLSNFQIDIGHDGLLTLGLISQRRVEMQKMYQILALLCRDRDVLEIS